MAKRKAIYAAVVLEESSAAEMRRLAEEHFGVILPKEFCHHCTLRFKPTPEQVKAMPIGDRVDLHVVGVGQDEQAQAVMVDSYHDALQHCANETAHITIACSEEGKPAHSNELTFTACKTWEPIFWGRVGIFTGKDVQYTLEGTIYEDA